MNVTRWVADLRKVTGEIPIVVVGNKVDLPQRVVKASSTHDAHRAHWSHMVAHTSCKAQEGSMMMRKLKVQYYDVSVWLAVSLKFSVSCFFMFLEEESLAHRDAALMARQATAE